MMAAITIQEAGPGQFEEFPQLTGPRKNDPYEAVLPALQSGKELIIQLEDEAKVRGARMAIGRRAKEAGIQIEMRYRGNEIAVRSVGITEPVKEKPRGRRKKGEGTAAEA